MADSRDWQAVARDAAQQAGLDPDFVTRLIQAESNWNPTAVSRRGAMGLMQVLPATARQYGVKNLLDPSENIKAGVAYLKDLHQKYGGRQDLVAAAYNAGEGAVDRAGGVPRFRETQAYVQKVATPSAATVNQAAESSMPEPQIFLDVQGNPIDAQGHRIEALDVQGNPTTPTKQTPLSEESSALAAHMGPRLRGGYTVSDVPESRTSQTIRGMISPTPEQQLGMDVLPFVAGGVGSAAKRLTGEKPLLAPPPGARTVANVTRAVTRAATSPETAARLVKHGATATGAAVGGVPGAIVGSQLGEELASRIRARLALVKPAGAPPRVVGKAPTLTESLNVVLEELRNEPQASVTAPASPGAAPGGSAAADLTMRQLAEQPPVARRVQGPSVSPEARGAQPAYRQIEEASSPGMGPREGLPEEGPPTGVQTRYQGPEIDLTSQVGGTTPMQARAAERFGRVYTSEGGAGRPSMPMNQAVNAVHRTAIAAKVRLTAEQFAEASKFVQSGRATPAEAVEAIKVIQQLKESPSFAKLPTDAEMRADMARRAMAGQKSLMGEYGPEAGTNPFR